MPLYLQPGLLPNGGLWICWWRARGRGWTSTTSGWWLILHSQVVPQTKCRVGYFENGNSHLSPTSHFSDAMWEIPTQSPLSFTSQVWCGKISRSDILDWEGGSLQVGSGTQTRTPVFIISYLGRCSFLYGEGGRTVWSESSPKCEAHFAIILRRRMQCRHLLSKARE